MRSNLISGLLLMGISAMMGIIGIHLMSDMHIEAGLSCWVICLVTLVAGAVVAKRE